MRFCDESCWLGVLPYFCLLQFIEIMDNVFPKFTTHQFKTSLESLYFVHMDDETAGNSTKRNVQSHLKLLDAPTGHTKSDFIAVMVRASYDVLNSNALHRCSVCRLYARSSLPEVVLVTINLKTYMRS